MKHENKKIIVYAESDITTFVEDSLDEILEYDETEGYMADDFIGLFIKVEKFIKENGFSIDIPEEKETEYSSWLNKFDKTIKPYKISLIKSIIKDLFEQMEK